MSHQLRTFLRAARSAGLPVSTAEGLDAHRVLAAIGFDDRTTLRDALGLVLSKTEEQRVLYEECFDLFFSAAPHEERPDGEADIQFGEEADGLEGMLAAGSGPGLSMAIQQAGERVGVEDIRWFTQLGLYTRRIMQAMGATVLEERVAAELARAKDDDIAHARHLEAQLRRLRQQVREHVDRQFAIHARNAGSQLRGEILARSRIASIDRRDLDRVRVMVRALARKLASRHGVRRKRKNRGQLDLRRTMRKNMAFGGVPFTTHWRVKAIDRPRLMVLCDVSNSVAEVAEFLLLFVHGLSECVRDVRAFAFTGTMIEITDKLKTQSVEVAIPQVLDRIGPRGSDYGSSFADFSENWMREVNRNTAIIILGDARGNNADPRVEILREMRERARRIIWLNPEWRGNWGSGDSDMLRYEPFCHTTAVCNSVEQLDRALGEMMSTLR